MPKAFRSRCELNVTDDVPAAAIVDGGCVVAVMAVGGLGKGLTDAILLFNNCDILRAFT